MTGQLGRTQPSESQVALTEVIEGEVVCRNNEYSDGNVDADHPCKGHEIVHTAEKDREFRDGST